MPGLSCGHLSELSYERDYLPRRKIVGTLCILGILPRQADIFFVWRSASGEVRAEAIQRRVSGEQTLAICSTSWTLR